MMEPITLAIDSSNSKITVRTRAAGMLARLAHDLELSVIGVRGEAIQTDSGFSGTITIPVSSLRVSGQLHGERVDPSGISNSDRTEIERKLREEVFAGSREIRVRGQGLAWNHVDVTVDTGLGKMPISTSIQHDEVEDRIRISGRTELSLSKLGVREIKGPLGAFKVKDNVEVLFEITLRRAG